MSLSFFTYNPCPDPPQFPSIYTFHKADPFFQPADEHRSGWVFLPILLKIIIQAPYWFWVTSQRRQGGQKPSGTAVQLAFGCKIVSIQRWLLLRIWKIPLSSTLILLQRIGMTSLIWMINLWGRYLFFVRTEGRTATFVIEKTKMPTGGCLRFLVTFF